MRGIRLWILIIAAVLASMVLAAHASAEASGPRLVCLTDFDGSNTAYGAYKYKPHKCVVHERGEPFAGYTLVGLRRLRWSSWSGQARGRAVIRGNMGWKAKARIRLLKPRRPCGTTVFSLLKIRYRVVSGGGGRGSSRVHLDTCLR